MAQVAVKLPAGLRQAGMPPSIEVEAATVREALTRAVAVEPRLEGRVFTADGGFAIAVFVNGISAKRLRGMDTPVADGDLLSLLPPIAGG